MAKWPNHFIYGKQFQKGQIWQIWPLKRPNGNPEKKNTILEKFMSRILEGQSYHVISAAFKTTTTRCLFHQFTTSSFFHTEVLRATFLYLAVCVSFL
jgi:hypothetical protein